MSTFKLSKDGQTPNCAYPMQKWVRNLLQVKICYLGKKFQLLWCRVCFRGEKSSMCLFFRSRPIRKVTWSILRKQGTFGAYSLVSFSCIPNLKIFLKNSQFVSVFMKKTDSKSLIWEHCSKIVTARVVSCLNYSLLDSALPIL